VLFIFPSPNYTIIMDIITLVGKETDNLMWTPDHGEDLVTLYKLLSWVKSKDFPLPLHRLQAGEEV
jgi:hypothetical protein